MGAHSFYTTSQGRTAKEAFTKAVQDARYEYGHGGYTGTIAEKDKFVMIECPKGAIPEEYANELLNNSDYRIDDKWGPAGCIDLRDGSFLFFGWASS